MSRSCLPVPAWAVLPGLLLATVAQAQNGVRVDGHSIGSASFSRGGSISFVKDQTWRYIPSSGGHSISLTVNGRDDWSVYFTDGAAGCQLDYHTRRLLRNGKHIESVARGEVGPINGRNVGRVVFTGGAGNGVVLPDPNGNNPNKWIVNVHGQHVVMSLIGRDEWSVYVRSNNPAVAWVQADLHRRVVVVRDAKGNRKTYGIVQTDFFRINYRH